jgi:cwf18 pre-mRNA splicing factor
MAVQAKASEAQRRDTGDAESELRRIRFRNYRPRDEKLQICLSTLTPPSSSCLESFATVAILTSACAVTVPDCEQVPNAKDELIVLQAEQDRLLSSSATKFASADLDLENLIPKKANWELKRALKPRLDRLERRTQRALVEIVRVAAQGSTGAGSDGAQLARAVASAGLADPDEDDY